MELMHQPLTSLSMMPSMHLTDQNLFLLIMLGFCSSLECNRLQNLEKKMTTKLLISTREVVVQVVINALLPYLAPKALKTTITYVSLDK